MSRTEYQNVPMYELYRNINLSPNPFIIVPDEDDEEDSDDDTVFKWQHADSLRILRKEADSGVGFSPIYPRHSSIPSETVPYSLESPVFYSEEEMADEPGHKAMLYFLEILMNSGVPLTISQLAGRFGSKSFTPDMRQACGGNESGLKKFLLKFPSLFCVSGNLVSLNDGTANLGKNFRESSPASTTSDVSVETEAVQYFRAKIIRKGEKWMHVLSLAGHLSQANAEIRDCVGPQNQFREWLERHPLIFDIRGDQVSLKDNINYSAVNPSSESLDLDGIQFNANQRYSVGDNNRYSVGDNPRYSVGDNPRYSVGDNPRYSVGDNPRFSQSVGDFNQQPRTPKLKRRPKSIEIPPNSPKPSSLSRTPSFTSQNLPTPLSAKSGPATMTANEYKAVMFLKGIIEKKGDMKLNGLTGHFSQAPESLRNTIGWSKPELEKFVRSHANIFVISEDETVSVIKNARLNVIITGSRPSSTPTKAGKQGQGRVYHVAKLWGIVDLGKHEHVFIDRTIFGKQIDDLNKLLTVGEMVCFDSIPAPKGSRARWRAIKIWKEHESIEDLVDKVTARLGYTLSDGSFREPMTPNSPMPISNIDEEIRRMIPELNDSSVIQSPVNVGGIKYSFSDAAPSGAGVVPVWNFRHQELSAMRDIDDLDLSDDSDAPSLSMVAEKYYMNRSVLGDTPKKDSGETEVNGQDQAKPEEKKTATTIGCQTIVTGEVLATQLFHEDV
ncbi:EGAL1-like protein [Mya arenaria]|uniref:EGAL1-like protein n=1 Tax=Mya arenaria TaxID=6604 RepID=A0ABY7G0S8_MYAAR|nr:EGAL1-like protein [Mya arenaria]